MVARLAPGSSSAWSPWRQDANMKYMIMSLNREQMRTSIGVSFCVQCLRCQFQLQSFNVKLRLQAYAAVHMPGMPDSAFLGNRLDTSQCDAECMACMPQIFEIVSQSNGRASRPAESSAWHQILGGVAAAAAPMAGIGDVHASCRSICFMSSNVPHRWIYVHDQSAQTTASTVLEKLWSRWLLLNGQASS